MFSIASTIHRTRPQVPPLSDMGPSTLEWAARRGRYPLRFRVESWSVDEQSGDGHGADPSTH